MPEKFIPKEALDYIKNKNLKVGFSYKDVWNEEHATAFTVAKAMQIDVLSDLKKAVEKAIEDGQSFETFKKNIKPTLQQKGWWGKKQMTDPLTGREVNAQLGSDRRLKTIYNVNLRSAYQKGQYERTMASDLHPYLMYRVGNSQKHREQHLAWDGLILPKDDPFWNNHFPPNGYGCKCYTRAVTEARKQRYENEGIKVPPAADGSGGGTLRIKTKAPPDKYRNYFNERKGTLERLPQGITPGFNWNQGQTGRTIPVLQECLKKAQQEMPQAVDSVIKTLQNSTIYRDELSTFVDEAYKNKDINRVNARNTTPVGFFDKKIIDFLHTQGIDADARNIIVLEQHLITSDKYLKRHAAVGNAPTRQDWKNLLDYLADADVYWDGRKKNSLLFLKKLSEMKYLKIAVDVSATEKYLKLPKIDTMFYMDISTESESGIEAYRNIIKLKKIR